MALHELRLAFTQIVRVKGEMLEQRRARAISLQMITYNNLHSGRAVRHYLHPPANSKLPRNFTPPNFRLKRIPVMAVEAYMEEELRLATNTITEHINRLQQDKHIVKKREKWRLNSIKTYFVFIQIKVNDDMKKQSDKVNEKLKGLEKEKGDYVKKQSGIIRNLEKEKENLTKELKQAKSCLKNNRILLDIRINENAQLREENQRLLTSKK